MSPVTGSLTSTSHHLFFEQQAVTHCVCSRSDNSGSDDAGVVVDVEFCSSKRKHIDKSKPVKRIKKSESYIDIYKNVSSKVEDIALSFSCSEASIIYNLLKKRTLSVEDLFVVKSIVEKHIPSTTRSEAIHRYLKYVFASCNTDDEKSNLLRWIPDSLKSGSFLMNLFHEGLQCLSKQFKDGSLPCDKLVHVVSTVSLCLGKKHCIMLLSKYKNKVDATEFNALLNVIECNYYKRTENLKHVLDRIESTDWKRKLLPHVVPSTSSAQNIVCDVIPSWTKERSVYKTIYNAKSTKNRTKKSSPKVPENRKEEIKLKLFDGSLLKEDIVSARSSLLIDGVPREVVARWFRIYRKKISERSELSYDCKKDIFLVIDSSYEQTMHLIKSEEQMSPEIVDLIKMVKAGNVKLIDIKNIKSKLTDSLGTERAGKLCVSLKKKLLLRRPDMADEINAVFLAALKRKQVQQLSEDDSIMLASLNDGSISVDRLYESVNHLLTLRNKEHCMKIVANYVRCAMHNGVSKLEILGNLPYDVKSSVMVIRAISSEDYNVVLSLYNNTLPFERLEEASYTASMYLAPNKLFKVLLHYVYRKSIVSRSEYDSFFKLINTLMHAGLVEIPKVKSDRDSLESESGHYEHGLLDCTNVLSIVDILGHAECVDSVIDLNGFDFDGFVDNMFGMYGTDMVIEDFFQNV